MNYFYLRGNMDNELLEKFISFYNNAGEQITIVVDSRGGWNTVADAMIYMINQKPDVTIIILQAMSSAMYLAVKTKGAKVLTQTCLGMWHYTKWGVDFNDKNKPYYREDEATLKNMPNNKKINEAFAKSIMTATEFLEYKKDEDVYFPFTRMKQIFPNAIICKK